MLFIFAIAEMGEVIGGNLAHKWMDLYVQCISFHLENRQRLDNGKY